MSASLASPVRARLDLRSPRGGAQRRSPQLEPCWPDGSRNAAKGGICFFRLPCALRNWDDAEVSRPRFSRFLPLGALVLSAAVTLPGAALAQEDQLPNPKPSASSAGRAQALTNYRRLLVGDSLSASVAGALSAQGFTVNAKVGRQFGAARAILASYGRQLPANVVLALGTNGPVSLAMCQATVSKAPNRRVFLVTNHVPRSWEAANNRNLRRCAADNRLVKVIDWQARSQGHRSFFAADGYHLSKSGRYAFTRLLDAAVDG